MAAIHRQVSAIAKEQGWTPPSYGRVRQIIKHLDPALEILQVRVEMPASGRAVRGTALDIPALGNHSSVLQVKSLL